MAQIPYAANLTSAAFPFLADQMNLTVIVRQLEDIFARNNDSSQTMIPDQSVPQLYFGENIMPTGRGYQSVGMYKVAENIPATFTPPSQYMQTCTFNARNSVSGVIENKTFRFVTNISTGLTEVWELVYDSPSASYLYYWSLVQTLPPGYAGDPTYATVNGVTYFVFSNDCTTSMKYNPVSNQLEVVTLTGLSSAFKGIFASSGYLIAYGDLALAWSSTVDPEDFVPSLTTGAGGGNVQDIDGAITTCLPINNGFIVYGSKNCVASTYTGNQRFPFQFRALPGSGGIASRFFVGYQITADVHFAYTTRGLQTIALNGAKPVYAELNDFLAGRTYEKFNFSTKRIDLYNVNQSLLPKIRIVSGRYITFSYGELYTLPNGDSIGYEGAIVLDMALGRFGKINLPHLELYEFNFSGFGTQGSELLDDNRSQIALQTGFGSTWVVDLDLRNIDSYEKLPPASVAILGKYQLQRAQMMNLQEITLTNVDEDRFFELHVVISLDGKNISSINFVDPTYATRNGDLYSSYVDLTGYNHSLMCIGEFDLNTLQFLCVPAGRL